MKTYQEKILEDKYTVSSSLANTIVANKESSIGSDEALKKKNTNITSV